MNSTPNTFNKKNLNSKVVALIGYVMTWFIMFPIFVVSGILSIVVDRVFQSKDDANTRLTISDESKIPPKKTSKDSVPVFKSESRNEYGVPIELIEQKRKAKV